MQREFAMLKVDIRSKLGSRYSRRHREDGRIPGVVYGHKISPVAVSFDSKQLLSHVNAGERVYRLDFPGESNLDEGQMVLLKGVQFDYLGTNLIHVDFARVDLNERVHTKVHMTFKGEAKGLKTAGAIMMHPTVELDIECKVVDLPDALIVDVTDLGLDEQITAGQVKLPIADMKLLTDSHAVVAQIVEQKEQVVAEAAAVGTEAVAPEVIGEKERAEKAAAKEGGAKPAAGGAKAAAPAAKK